MLGVFKSQVEHVLRELLIEKRGNRLNHICIADRSLESYLNSLLENNLNKNEIIIKSYGDRNNCFSRVWRGLSIYIFNSNSGDLDELKRQNPRDPFKSIELQ